MHDQPDIGLVDPHAKGVGRSDHPQLAGAKRLLHITLAVRGKACVKEIRGQPLPFQELCHFFRRAACGTIDHGAGCPFGRQVGLDRGQDIGQLGRLLRRQHRKGQVGAHRPAIEQHQIDPEAGVEMVADVAHHLGLGRGGQAQDGCRGIARELLDEAADIAVIRPEIVPPFADAMRLVQHPKANLALVQHRSDRRRAQLFGRDQQHRCIAHPHLFQRIVAFGQRQHAVHRDRAGNPRPRQPLHLIGHQRHQRRDHHRQRPGRLEPRQRRDLVADRFAGAGGQDAQHGFARHRLGHNALLQGAADVIDGLRAEGRKAEPAFQCCVGVVLLNAPAASRIAAIGVAQMPHDAPRLRKLHPHPGRHDGLPARHRNPRQRVGHRPAVARIGQAAQRLLQPVMAGAAVQQATNGGMGRGLAGRGPTQGLEQRIEPGRSLAPRRQMVIGQSRIRHLLPQPRKGRNLIGQHLQRKPRVLNRVIHMPDLQPPVLIVLDQMVVRIARKGQGVQPQRIHRRRPQSREPRPIGHQMRQVMAQDVVADQMHGPGAKRLQPIQRRVQRCPFVNQRRLAPHRRKGEQPRRFRINLQIDRDAACQEWGGVKGQTW